MILLLAALGLVLLTLPALPRRALWRVPARDRALLLVGALCAGTLTFVAALVLASIPAVASLLDAPAIVDQCRGLLAPIATDPTALTWVTLASAVWIVARCAHGTWRAHAKARDARVEPWLGEHRDRGDYELVVLPTHDHLAFGVPGRQPQVVVSSGLLERLTPVESDAVLAHEAAHHRLHHARWVAALAGIERAFGLLPPLRRGLEVTHAAIEGWADDAAGYDASTRSAIRSALGRLARPGSHADQRVRSLAARVRRADPIVRFVSFAPVVLMAITALAIVAGWLTDAHHAVALGTQCDH